MGDKHLGFKACKMFNTLAILTSKPLSLLLLFVQCLTVVIRQVAKNQIS